MSSSNRGLLPTWDERAAGTRSPRHGTELADTHPGRSSDDSEDISPRTPRPHAEPATSAPNSGASKQRVFRVTTLEDRDYDSIPLQRLKNVVGTDGWTGRAGVWLLVILALLSVVATTCYMHAKTRYLQASRLSVEVCQLDTSSNDVVKWLKLERHAPKVRAKYPTMSNPSSRVHTTVTSNPRRPLKIARAGGARRGATGESGVLNSMEILRLPVGLATTLDIQQMMQSKEFDDDITPGHDSTFHRLKTLREALPVDLYQKSSNRRVQIDLLRLLRVARRAKVVTEVPVAMGTGQLTKGWGGGFSELHIRRVRTRLIQQLHRFVECTRKGAQVPCSVYTDIMRYPDSASLLYWGKFSLLRFNGPGVLYWRNGLVAYNGSWADGSMQGEGQLSDKFGNLVWTGMFKKGHPQWTISSLWHNYFSVNKPM